MENLIADEFIALLSLLVDTPLIGDCEMGILQFRKIMRACVGVAQIAAVTLGGTDLAYAQCTQSSPCASLTKLGAGLVVGHGGITEEQFFLEFRPIAISGDGGVIVGIFNPSSTGPHVFRWTLPTGLIDLGAGFPFSVNRDGSVVVGRIDIGSGIPTGAFRWTNSGLVNLGNGVASRVSSDGSVVAGESSGSHLFRWTSATGMVDLGTLGGNTSGVSDMSSDGSTVVGESALASSNNPRHAFRWTSATGMVDLGTLGVTEPGVGGTISGANATNSDGSVIVGGSFTTNSFHAFRWTKATGMVDLGTLGDDNPAVVVTGISSDGLVIVGNVQKSDNNFPKRPYRWTSATGLQDLNTLLSKAGVNMSN